MPVLGIDGEKHYKPVKNPQSVIVHGAINPMMNKLFIDYNYIYMQQYT